MVKTTHGGPDRGQGRKPKPLKFSKRLISLPPELNAKLKDVNASQLIQKLLIEYFEGKEK